MEIVIINLVHRRSRRARILALASALKEASQSTKYPITRIHLMEAVDGVTHSFEELHELYGGLSPFPYWQLEDKENRYPSSWRGGLTSGGIASGLSHMDVVKVCKNNSPVLVMEDDCVLTSTDPESVVSYFIACIEEAISSVPDWDMLLLGASGHRRDLSAAQPVILPNGLSSDLIEMAGFSYLTTMYFLSPRGRRKLELNRSATLGAMLPFDELHNAMAGLTPRDDVIERISHQCHRLVLLSSQTSYVRQDPHDCVHDTLVSSKRKQPDTPETDSTEGVFDKSELIPFKTFFPLKSGFVPVTWWRRDTGLSQSCVQSHALASKAKHVKQREGVLAVINRERERRFLETT
jgi:GR25 family glycosyltransferase involved in LPS biosynthesis